MYLMMETIPIGKLISLNGWRCINGGTIATTVAREFRIYTLRDIIKWKINPKDNPR